MQIEVANQRILLLKDLLSPQQAKDIAWQKKVGAFDALSKVTSFLSKPKDEDFSLTYSEHRYEPFWHVISRARYEYTRTTNYQIASSGKEVRTVTIHDTKYDVLNGHLHVPVLEYCLQEERDEKILDGITGKDAPLLKQYLSMAATEVQGQLKDEAFCPPAGASRSRRRRNTSRRGPSKSVTAALPGLPRRKHVL